MSESSPRGSTKLAAALDAFHIEPPGKTCADLGCNVGGFTQVLLDRGASRVFAVDTGYGTLAPDLRSDPRVIAMERTNALAPDLRERIGTLVDLVVIDVAWTAQRKILPAALDLLAPNGDIVSLLKPHYEATEQTEKGILRPEVAEEVAHDTIRRLEATGFTILAHIESPIEGGKGNREFLLHLRA